MRVAIATQDMTRIDAHLGWARHLMIYEISAEGYHHVHTASFHSGVLQDGDHSKLEPRLEALRGCTLVFVADVGPEGEHGLARQRIVPMRQFAGQPLAAALDTLRDGFRRSPPPWLRRELQREQRARINEAD